MCASCTLAPGFNYGIAPGGVPRAAIQHLPGYPCRAV